MIRLLGPICLPLLLAALFIPCPAQANVLSLDNLVLDNRSGRIHLCFDLRLADTAEIKPVLQKGVDLWLSGTARLVVKRLLIPNQVLSEKRIEHVLEWNPLSREFELTLPQREHHVKNKDLGKLLATHWREISLDMGDWSMLSPGRTYHVELEISLDRRDIPVWMRSVLFFWSFEIVTPIHYELEFVVP